MTIPDTTINRIKETCLDFTTDYETCIGVNQSSTFLVAGAGLVQDQLLPSLATVEPIPVRDFSTDVILPSVVSFHELDLNEFTLTVQFSEPVQLPVNLTLFTLHFSDGMTIDLLPANSSYDPSDHTFVQFQLDSADIQVIKLSSGF